jgi:hypothetical protein
VLKPTRTAVGPVLTLLVRTRAGYQDAVSTGFDRAPLAGFNFVSSITLHSKAGSENIDAISVGYNNSGTEVLGSNFAAYSGRERGNINLWAEDRVRKLYIWTDSSQLVVKGVMLVLARGVRLSSSSNLDPAGATVRKDKPGELGSGLLLGIAAAAKPGTEALSAVGFAFMKAPVSAAIAVDMEKIDIESARITPRHKLFKSTVNSNIDIEAFCPAVSVTEYNKNAYTQQPGITAVKARVEALMGAPLFTGDFTKLKRSTELVATETQVISGRGAVSDTWQRQVREVDRQPDGFCSQLITNARYVLQVSDVFDNAGELTSEAGRSTTISVQAAKFVIKKGEQVECSFLYWTHELTASYTVTATLFFDGEGSTAWTTSVGGERELLYTEPRRWWHGKSAEWNAVALRRPLHTKYLHRSKYHHHRQQAGRGESRWAARPCPAARWLVAWLTESNWL